MRKYYVMAIAVFDIVLFALFLFSSSFHGDIFGQTSYSTTHLTRTDWGYFTITVHDYYYADGTLTPSSGISVYLNYPFILSFIFMSVNMLFAIVLLSKESQNFNSQV